MTLLIFSSRYPPTRPYLCSHFPYLLVVFLPIPHMGTQRSRAVVGTEHNHTASPWESPGQNTGHLLVPLSFLSASF